MWTFKEYLTEIARSDNRAFKLGKYLADRQHKYRQTKKGTIRHRDHTDLEDLEYHPAFIYSNHAFDKHGTDERLPIKHLKAAQDSVDFNDKTKFKKSLNDKRKVLVVKQRGQHYIYDGHHRVMSRRLKGDTHINARVLDLDTEDWD